MTPGTGAGWVADGFGAWTKVCEECGELFGGAAAGVRPNATRCPPCRQRRLADRNERMLTAYASGAFGPRLPTPGSPGSEPVTAPVHVADCAACGRPARLPFRPRDDRPVYCRPCHEARHGR